MVGGRREGVEGEGWKGGGEEEDGGGGGGVEGVGVAGSLGCYGVG